MAVFYKYVDRQVSDQINWADISKSMSQTFEAERDAREKKKAEIDQASLEYIEKLQSQPETESADLNTRLSQFTNDASSLQKANLDDLKAGRINLRDYTLRSQNLKSNSEVALDLIQTYGKRYSEVMDGINDKKYSAAQADFMSRFEGFANLVNNKLYIEPTTGRVFAANEVLDPKTGIKKMGDKIQSVISLKNMMQQDIPRMDLDAEITERTDKLGGFITGAIKRGGLDLVGKEVKFKDATQQQYYNRYVKDLTSEFAGGDSNPNAISFFVDNMRTTPAQYDDKGNIVKEGVPYKIVFSEADRKAPSDILVKQGAGGVYFASLTKEQMDAAEEHIKVTMRQKIEKATEENAFNLQERRPKTDEERAADAKKKEEKDKMSFIMQLAFPTSTTSRQAALNYINDLQPKGKDSIPVVYSFTDDGDLLATYNNDPNSTRVFKIDENMTKDQWAATTREISGITDVGRVLRENTFPTSKKASKPAKGTVTSGVTQRNPVQVMQGVVGGIQKLDATTVKGDASDSVDENVVISQFSDVLSPYGFKVTSGGSSIRDEIRISNSDGTKYITVNVDDYTDDFENIMKQVKSFVTNSDNISKEAVRAASKANAASETSTGTKLNNLQNNK